MDKQIKCSCGYTCTSHETELEKIANKISHEELVMLDPGFIEGNTRPLLYSSLSFQNLFNLSGLSSLCNLKYFGGEEGTACISSVGNAIYLSAPDPLERARPKIEIINQEEFGRREHLAEKIYVGKKEIIPALRQMPEMEFYADVIEKGGLYTRIDKLPFWVKIMRNHKPDFWQPLRFKNKVMNGTFL